MSEEKETKVCKYCKSEIPKKAKVCPNCRKKQGGIGKWIVIAVIVIIVIAAISGGGDDKDKNPQKISQTPSDDKQTSSENKKTDDTETQDKSNVFQVGDVGRPLLQILVHGVGVEGQGGELHAPLLEGIAQALQAAGFQAVGGKRRSRGLDLWAVATKGTLQEAALRELAMKALPA